jgi:hypothetical protein
MTIPNSRQKPRKALMRLVRVPIHRLRMRCRPLNACCATLLTCSGGDVGATRGCGWCGRIGGIGFITFDVGPDISRGQQGGYDAQTAQPAGPAMGGAARFEDDAADHMVLKPSHQLIAA